MSRALDAENRRRARRMLSEYPRAEAKPWISDLIVDVTGAVWVEEYEPWWSDAERMWAVFSPEGAWLGRIRFPSRFEPRAIGDDYVLGVWKDDLDVEHVQAYGLQR